MYELTEWGYEAEPIFQALGRWAARSPHHDTSLPFSTNSLIMSLRTMFSVEKAAGFKARIALRIGAEAYVAEFANGAFTIERAEPKGADAILEGDARSIAGVIYGGVPLEALEAAGALKASGDREKLMRFFTLFPLPPKAPTRAGALTLSHKRALSRRRRVFAARAQLRGAARRRGAQTPKQAW